MEGTGSTQQLRLRGRVRCQLLPITALALVNPPWSHRDLSFHYKPVPLSNIRSNGVSALIVYCSAPGCHHSGELDASRWPDQTTLNELQPHRIRSERDVRVLPLQPGRLGGGFPRGLPIGFALCAAAAEQRVRQAVQAGANVRGGGNGAYDCDHRRVSLCVRPRIGTDWPALKTQGATPACRRYCQYTTGRHTGASQRRWRVLFERGGMVWIDRGMLLAAVVCSIWAVVLGREVAAGLEQQRSLLVSGLSYAGSEARACATAARSIGEQLEMWRMGRQ